MLKEAKAIGNDAGDKIRSSKEHEKGTSQRAVSDRFGVTKSTV